MKVFMFKPRFAALVEAGTKRQTVRPTRVHPVAVGDHLSLRAWTGKPYRSEQRLLLDVPCTGVAPVRISRDLITVDCRLLGGYEADAFARADGFESWLDMFGWFEEEHGPDEFNGFVTYW